jgi:hypothetical protein
MGITVIDRANECLKKILIGSPPLAGNCWLVTVGLNGPLDLQRDRQSITAVDTTVNFRPR